MVGIEKSVYKIGALKDITLMRVKGYIDTTTSSDLQKAIAEEMNKGSNQFIIDLGGVQYVSSAGWGVFVGEIRGLRESGGDLKITQMTPEVSEVFEMLEFNRILTSYESLDEAMDDFDFCRGIQINSPRNGSLSESIEEPEGFKFDYTPKHIDKSMSTKKTISFSKRQQEINETDLPVTEKIKKIVVEDPMIGLWGIRKKLKSERFGFTKLGVFRLRSTLKRMGMHTKLKRYRYYRSR